MSSALDYASRNGQSYNATINAVLSKFGSSLNVMIPCHVTAVDRQQGRVSVKPSIKHVDVNGTAYSRNVLHQLPILSLGGGGFSINFPIKVGDVGWIIACDRDIHNFLDQHEEKEPNTYRSHLFSDSLFVPDMFNKLKVQEDSKDGVVLQKHDGATRIVLNDDNITIITDGKTYIKADQGLTIDANVQVNGTLQVSKDVRVDAGIHASGDVKAGSISLNSHVHGGVQSGGGSTTPPK